LRCSGTKNFIEKREQKTGQKRKVSIRRKSSVRVTRSSEGVGEPKTGTPGQRVHRRKEKKGERKKKREKERTENTSSAEARGRGGRQNVARARKRALIRRPEVRKGGRGQKRESRNPGKKAKKQTGGRM